MRSPDITTVLDARSLPQLLYMLSVLETETVANNCILVWQNEPRQIKNVKHLVTLPNQRYFVDAKITDDQLFFDTKTISRIKGYLSEIVSKSKKIRLFTSYNHGLYFEILRKHLKVADQDIYLFDDGLANLLKIKNRYILKTFMYIFHGIFGIQPKYRLMHDSRLKHAYTLFSDNQKRDPAGGIEVTNISDKIKKYYTRLYYQYIDNDIHDNAALILGHHAVESGRMSANDYRSLITQTVNHTKRLGIQSIYLSKHHTETGINDEFYDSLDLISYNSDLPAEVMLCGKKIRLVAQPYNSLLPVADNLSLLGELDYVISYLVTSSPFIADRIDLINRITNQHRIEHITL